MTITVVGWAATTPKQVVGAGVPFASFRLASTPRRRDSRTGEWGDGKTEWFTVKAWRDAAFNVAASVQKSQPVVVHGRLTTDEWTDDKGVTRTTLVIEAATVGHDLTRGTAVFARRINVAPGAAEARDGSDGEQQPRDVDPWADEPAGMSGDDDEPVDVAGDDDVAHAPGAADGRTVAAAG